MIAKMMILILVKAPQSKRKRPFLRSESRYLRILKARTMMTKIKTPVTKAKMPSYMLILIKKQRRRKLRQLNQIQNRQEYRI